MKRFFGIIGVKKDGKLCVTDFTFKGMATDGLFYFGKGKEKWQAIRDARLNLVLKRYGFKHPSVQPISRLL